MLSATFVLLSNFSPNETDFNEFFIKIHELFIEKIKVPSYVLGGVHCEVKGGPWEE